MAEMRARSSKGMLRCRLGLAVPLQLLLVLDWRMANQKIQLIKRLGLKLYPLFREEILDEYLVFVKRGGPSNIPLAAPLRHCPGI